MHVVVALVETAWHCSTHRLGRCKRRIALTTQVLLLPVDIIAHVHCTIVGARTENSGQAG